MVDGKVVYRKVYLTLITGDIPFQCKMDGKRGTGTVQVCRRCCIRGQTGGPHSSSIKYYPLLDEKIELRNQIDLQNQLADLSRLLSQPGVSKADLNRKRRVVNGLLILCGLLMISYMRAN